MTKEKLEMAESLLKGVLDYDSFKDVDLVVEVSILFISFGLTILKPDVS